MNAPAKKDRPAAAGGERADGRRRVIIEAVTP